eukprot:TRINITY_DN9955_c0_g1_i7.p1 TRINITY_DN9955_c0_g1~~TRINITY_DN9955_c0_g1_i7.p1  ORF type:complete len:546 (+),score=184.54 TRINITY_DN9955_c0_g1_i7:46-1638(+)
MLRSLVGSEMCIRDSSKAGHEMFESVWGGLMAWMASNWMCGKGIHLSPLGKFIFISQDLDLGAKTRQKAKVPSFIPNEEYMRSYSIKSKSRFTRKEDGLAVEMNYANIAQFSKQSKDMVQLCLKDIFLHVGQTIGQGRKVSIDWYIGRMSAEHGILSFTFFDSDSLQKREAERTKGKHILSTRAPDNSLGPQGGGSGRGTARSRRSQYTPTSFGSAPRPQHDVSLDLGINRPPTVQSRSDMHIDTDAVKMANIRDVSNRSSYDASARSGRSSKQRSQRSYRSQSSYGGQQPQFSRPATGSSYYSGGGFDNTNSITLIGSKNKPDPGAPAAQAGYGSPCKAHVITDAYSRYEQDLKRRQEQGQRLEKDASDRHRLQQQVEVLKSEQKRREQSEMKKMLAKQVMECQKKREEERREKLVPCDLTHVLPLERERDFFQEYAEKQGMKRALFKQMEEKKAIKQRELDRERAMDMEAKQALAQSLAKEHALHSYQHMNAGQMLRDNWAKQIQLKEIESGVDGDCYAPEPQGKRRF